MKKIFSLLLVVAMIASLSLVAFAADTNTMSVEIVETDAGMVATVYVTNPTNVSGVQVGITVPTGTSCDKNTAYTLADDFTKMEVKASSKSGSVKFAGAFTSASDYITKTGKVAVISFPIGRTDDAVDLNGAFGYGSSLYVSSISLGDGSQVTSAKNADNFVAPVYVDNRTPVGGGEDEDEEDLEAWEAAFKYADTTSSTSTSYTGKKLVIFGKNQTSDKLAAESYGVNIGSNQYKGLIDVPAGRSWAIIIVDDGNTKINAPSYLYTPFTAAGEGASATVTVE